MRRLAWDAPEVNEEWNCDKGRFAFPYATQARITTPLVRDEEGNLVPASWPEAIRVAAAGLAKTGAQTGVLTGGRLTNEDALAYAGFARGVLGTNDVDFRARAVSDEETAFLANHVAGRGLDFTYADLEAAPAVLLVEFEPEDESPIVFLRLRKAARTRGTKVYSVAPYATTGLGKVGGTLIATAPHAAPSAVAGSAKLVAESGSIILIGERAASTPGLLTAVAELAAATGARIAWIPRRAGDRGALDAGLLPINGRNTEDIIDAVGSEVKGLVVAGVATEDLMADLEGAIERAEFVVSLETRHTDVTAIADVVFPVATVVEKAGTFRNWEGRDRSFTAVAPKQGVISDAAVLGEIAQAMGAAIVATENFWATADKPALSGTVVGAPALEAGQAELSSWRHLLDKGTMQDGEPYLAATSRVAVIRVSTATATVLGLTDGEFATVDCAGVTASARVIFTHDMVDGVVWMPANSEGTSLNLPSGFVVTVTAGGQA